ASTGGDGNPMMPGDLDGAHDIATAAHDDNAERFNLVDAGVGGIEAARDAVESDFPVDPALELASKSVDHANGSLVSQGVVCVDCLTASAISVGWRRLKSSSAPGLMWWRSRMRLAISCSAWSTTAADVALHMMSSSHVCPRTFFITVV